MPMCFNLFGPLWADQALAAAVLPIWWPELPGTPSTVRFEWSPGRQVPGRYLENRSAFDVAFETAQPDGSVAIVAVETKYHEHCARERVPSESRLERYRRVCDASGVFRPGAIEAIVGTQLQQIWLDHLLALSLLQEEARKYSWANFVLVHPAANPSYARAAAAYAELLVDDATFQIRTLESLLDVSAYPKERTDGFRERYFWSGTAAF